MTRALVLIAIAASLVSCAYNNYGDTTPTNRHSSDLNVTPFGQSVSNVNERTKSDYADCLAKNAGFDQAKEQCDAWITADRPGTMPRYQGWGWSPNYMGSAYPGGYRSGYVTPGMLYR